MNSQELIDLRKRFGWSQTEAAERLGCSKRSIVNWESGKHKIPESIALAASAASRKLQAYGKKKSRHA